MEAEDRPTKKRRVSYSKDAEDNANGTTLHEAMHGRNMNSTANDQLTPALDEAKGENGVGDADVSPTHNDDEPLSSHASNSLPYPSTTAPLADSISDDPGQPSLSKNQQKKLRKKQEWESKRDERKIIRKEKMIAKRERRREERKQQHPDGIPPSPPAKKRVPHARPVTLPVTILIDCDFDDLMRENERISLAGQITRSYSDNKNALFRAHLAVCSFGGKLRERFENVLAHHKGWRGVRFLDEGFVEAAEKASEWMEDAETDTKLVAAFSKFAPAVEGEAEAEEDSRDVEDEKNDSLAALKEAGEVVYLSSESDYTLTELKPYSTYIIGGLVDKNREKGICYKRAVRAGVKTARLPIGEFMEMQSRKVLATNHVNEIMLKWLECGDWGEAFLKVIPKRKGGKLKDNEDVNSGGQGDDVTGGDESDDETVEGHGGVPLEEIDADGVAFEGTEHGGDDPTPRK